MAGNTTNQDTHSNKSYNGMYDKIVHDDNDFVGMIAYTLYKRRKQEYIKNFKLSNQDRNPSEKDIESFHYIAIQELAIKDYRESATTLTNLLVDKLASKKMDDIAKKVRYELKKDDKSFWYGIWQNVFASLLYSILLGLLIVIIWAGNLTPKAVVENIFSVEIHEKGKLYQNKPDSLKINNN